LLVALVLPQLNLSLKASDFLLGPFKTIAQEKLQELKALAKEKLG
jgi:hypothetical protein